MKKESYDGKSPKKDWGGAGKSGGKNKSKSRAKSSSVSGKGESPGVTHNILVAFLISKHHKIRDRTLAEQALANENERPCCYDDDDDNRGLLD